MKPIPSNFKTEQENRLNPPNSRVKNYGTFFTEDQWKTHEPVDRSKLDGSINTVLDSAKESVEKARNFLNGRTGIRN